MSMLPEESAYAYSDVAAGISLEELPQLGAGEGWTVCDFDKAESGRWQVCRFYSAARRSSKLTFIAMCAVA